MQPWRLQSAPSSPACVLADARPTPSRHPPASARDGAVIHEPRNRACRPQRPAYRIPSTFSRRPSASPPDAHPDRFERGRHHYDYYSKFNTLFHFCSSSFSADLCPDTPRTRVFEEAGTG